MALQIANPTVADKVARLAAKTGLTKTATVEWAVDQMLRAAAPPDGVSDRLSAILRQLDAIPDLPNGGSSPVEWDSNGLPA